MSAYTLSNNSVDSFGSELTIGDIDGLEKFVSIHAYQAADPMFLSFPKGATLYIYSKDVGGWWDASDGLHRGWVPSNYLKPFEEDFIRKFERVSLVQNAKSGGNVMETLDRLVVSMKSLEDVTATRSSKRSIDNIIKINVTDTSINCKSSDDLVDDLESPLPAHWNRKVAPDGTKYYYNVRTNITTFDYSEVIASAAENRRLSEMSGRRKSALSRAVIPPTQDGRRKSIMFINSESPSQINSNNNLASKRPGSIAVINTPIEETAKKSDDAELYNGAKSYLVPGEPVTRDTLITNIYRQINLLDQYADREELEKFMDASFKVASCVRDIIVTSGGLDSAPDPTNPVGGKIRSCQLSLLSAASKVILYAKAASGLWPPPDAILKMRYHSGQVLVGTKKFMELCIEHKIELVPYSQDMAVRELDNFFSVSSEASRSEFIMSFSDLAEQAISSVQSLSVESSNLMVMLDLAKSIISRVGEMTALVEEIEAFLGEDRNTRDMNIFQTQVDDILSAATELLQICQVVSGLLPPPNAPDLIRSAAANVVVIIPKLTMQAKRVLESRGSPIDRSRGSKKPHSVRNSKRMSKISELRDRARRISTNDGSTSKNSSISEVSPNQTQISSSLKTDRLLNLSSTFEITDFSSEVEVRLRSESTGRSSFVSKISSGKDIKVFLQDTATPNELTLNMEGAVSGGTLEALVEKLTSSASPPDSNYVNSFLLTFRTFAEPADVLDLMINRYNLGPPSSVVEDEDLKEWLDKKAIPVRNLVCQVLVKWIEEYWDPAKDNGILPDVVLFADGPLMEDGQRAIAARMLSAADLIAGGQPSIRKKNLEKVWARVAQNAPSSIIPKKCTLLDIDTLEMARQITLIDSKIFNAIEPSELLKLEWAKKSSSLAVNVRAMTKLSTKLTGWIAETILAEQDIKQRCVVLKQFIKLGIKLHELKNYNALMAVYSALTSSTISRLKKTWNMLATKNKNEFDELKQSVDGSRNYAEYRAKLRAIDTTTTNCLPFLGLYLTDLTFTEEGNPDFRPRTNLINFDKRTKVARSIFEIQKFQQPYALKSVPVIQEWLIRCFGSCKLDDQQMYSRSLELEPREG